MSSQTAFPLQIVTTGDLKALCQALWNWELCDSCLDAAPKGLPHCGVASCNNCPWGLRAERLEPFFDFYRKATRPYVPDFFGANDQAIRNHQDLRDIISFIKRHGAEQSRQWCMHEYFTLRGAEEVSSVPDSDKTRAFELAARIMTMTSLSCGNGEKSLPAEASWDVEDQQGDAPRTWRDVDTLSSTMHDLFVSRIHPNLQPSDSQSSLIRQNLTAANLKKMAGLRIESTDSLHNHLDLNPTTGVVMIFHHTGFLREHLLGTKTDSQRNASLSRLLALETLCTFQLLFPSEPSSQALLRNLVSKQGFDPDCLRFGTAPFELSGEKERAMRFPVWGTRLMHLYDEIENPKPRGRIEVWLERKSKSRHIMMVTMLGVLAAVLLGLLGLCLSIFQTWIAWQEWKDGSNR
ncbi:hypothetical protein QBC34DRAFT_306832 [Podospora aff. communis PSN243]|uniref:Uncharacterized protein n=1 Tax=Podospora aff. communis PSN243 TaxID=3040156 RepID=A0AAV9G9A2_9PEZI|nr:hypothetical protein QBC34DRAFT_306832 [Podospora aff. communis PSN243]